MSETWKAIPGEEGRYEVSGHGNLRLHPDAAKREPRLRPFKPASRFNEDSGWMECRLTSRRAIPWQPLAEIVLTVFKRPPNDGEIVGYRNGKVKDVRLSNLEWVASVAVTGPSCSDVTKTASEPEERPRKRHRSKNRGEGNGRAKLTEEVVEKIRAAWEEGMTQSQIAEYFGVGRVTIGDVIRRKSWKAKEAD